MKVAVIGATGRAGSCIVRELLDRGHHVTGIARNISAVAPAANLRGVSVDMAESAKLARVLAGHDVVVSSVLFSMTDVPRLIATVKTANPGRYIVVGGAGSLYSPGTTTRIVDSGQLPEAWMPEVRGGANFLDLLKAEKDLDWTFISPSMMFDVGPRTGKFRLGQDELLVRSDGSSAISFADYAIALVDEIEQPMHRRCRFTVGY